MININTGNALMLLQHDEMHYNQEARQSPVQ
jgi:hypothetical protein